MRVGVPALLLCVACLGLFLVAPSGRPARLAGPLPLWRGLAPDDKMTAYVDPSDLPKAVAMYAELTGRTSLPSSLTPLERLDDFVGGRLTRWHVLQPRARIDTGINYHRDGRWTAAEIKEQLESLFASQGLEAVTSGPRSFLLVPRADQVTSGRLSAQP